MSWRPLRITTVWAKAGYVAMWWVGGAALLGPWVTAVPALVLLSVVWDGVWLVIGTRIFRASEEPIAPPRPWWQATGRPKASFWWGVLATFLMLSALASVSLVPERAIEWWIRFVEYAVIAVFFFHSGIQLGRHPRTASLHAPLPKQRRATF